MNKLRQLIQVASVIAVCSAPMFAQSSVNLAANVPFGFNIGRKSIPAGEYKIYAQSGSPRLTVRNAEGSPVATLLTANASKLDSPKQSKLVFRVYGQRSYLAGVWTAGVSSGRELPKTAAEKESERAGILMQVAVLPVEAQ